ncbi:MAG TPA: ABC transporter permease [Gemmatimonadaceae bacterium]|nr:ABC transporter permease [Gemmatimonadaceae bacterium]
MARYFARRLLHALTTLFLVCTATFAIIHAAPGGPSVLADPKLTATERQAIERRLGIDRPLGEQYARWIGSVARGDLGNSFLYQVPNVQAIRERLPGTLLLAGTALLAAIVIALTLGTYCAARPGSVADHAVTVLASAAMAIPAFWLAMVLILLFAVTWGVLPAGGNITVGGTGSLGDRLAHLILPVTVLSAALTAELLRYARSSTRSALLQPFVRVAQAKGVSKTRLRRRHALRNALIPVVTLIGLQLPRLVGGAAVTETVFSWPGMGRLGVEAALSRDYPLVLAITLVISAAVAVVTLLVDIIYVWLDPRIRLART